MQGSANNRAGMVHWIGLKAKQQWRTKGHRLMGYRFITGGTLFRSFRLFKNIGVSAVIFTGEIGGGSLTAEITVDALIIDVVGSGDVFFVLVVAVGHFW